MHCVAEYPSKVENQNIGWIGTLVDRYGLRTGFSTHETGAELSTGAFAYCSGAQIFEKHVVSSTAETVNAYSGKPGTDSSVAGRAGQGNDICRFGRGAHRAVP